MSKSPFPDWPILLVDDEAVALRIARHDLSAQGMANVVEMNDSRQVMPFLAANEVAFVVLDLSMPHVTGRELLAAIGETYPEIPVVVSTANDDVSTAVECMKAGAFDYLVKPVDAARLLSTARRAIEIRELRRENQRLRDRAGKTRLEHPEAFDDIITADETMLELFGYAEMVARTSQPVLITGETGTGKELMAKAIHRLSGRDGKLVTVNVAGLDDNLFSDTLFGHVPGAFTGAVGTRPGLIEEAAGGTLFLDEIGDLSIPSQVKLLRLLQEREYRPLGGDDVRHSDSRVVVATHKDLAALQDASDFRRDLYYRLRSHHLHLPALRERPGDLPLLLAYFLAAAAAELGMRVPTVPPEADDVLRAHHWPGNIRELRSVVLDAVSKHRGGVLSLDSFRAVLTPARHASSTPADQLLVFGNRLPTLRQARQLLIDEALERAGGNQSVAARLLGVSRQSLNQQLRSRA